MAMGIHFVYRLVGKEMPIFNIEQATLKMKLILHLLILYLMIIDLVVKMKMVII